MSHPPRQERASDLSPAALAAGLFVLLLVGLYERLIVPGPPAVLTGTDSYYYGRLAWLSRLAFPHPVTFDTWVGFPGMSIQWQPGHAWIVAALQAAFGARAPFSPEGMLALSWTGPLLSLGGIGLLTWAALRLFGRWTALVVAGALLVQPFAADAGTLGEADHHVHEIFFAAACALALAWALRPRGSPVRAGLALGLAGGLPYLLTSAGFVLLPPLAAAVWALVLVRRRHRFRRALALVAAAASSLAVVLAGALWVGRFGASDYVRLSGFHVFLHAGILAAAAIPLAFAPSRALRRVALAAGAVGLALLAPTLGGAVRQALLSLTHLGGLTVAAAQCTECFPLLSEPANRALGATLLLAVPATLAAAALCRRSWGAAPWLFPLVAQVSLFAAATLAQSRWSRPLVGAAAVLAGLLLQRAAARASPGAARLAARLAAFALLVPPPIVLEPVSPGDADFIRDLTPALAWLREHTPPAGDPWRPDVPPGWAVLADWKFGHHLVALAERPVLASPFGLTAEAEEKARFVRESLRSEDPAATAQRCLERGLRYALVYEPPPAADARRSLRNRLAAGEDVPGFRAAFVGPPSGEGRVPRVFEIVPP